MFLDPWSTVIITPVVTGPFHKFRISCVKTQGFNFFIFLSTLTISWQSIKIKRDEKT